MIAYNSCWFHIQHELLCVFHGDRREGSKLKTALKKTHLPKVGFSFSAAPSYRYLPPLRQYTTIRHRETRSAPDPTATRHRETYPRASPAAKYLSTETVHRHPRRRHAVAPLRGRRRNRHAQHNDVQFESRTKNKKHPQQQIKRSTCAGKKRNHSTSACRLASLRVLSPRHCVRGCPEAM